MQKKSQLLQFKEYNNNNSYEIYFIIDFRLQLLDVLKEKNSDISDIYININDMHNIHNLVVKRKNNIKCFLMLYFENIG